MKKRFTPIAPGPWRVYAMYRFLSLIVVLLFVFLIVQPAQERSATEAASVAPTAPATAPGKY